MGRRLGRGGFVRRGQNDSLREEETNDCVLSCKSSVDLTAERLERRGIPYIHTEPETAALFFRGQSPDGLRRSETQEAVCQTIRNRRL